MLQNLFAATVNFANSLIIFDFFEPSHRNLPAHHVVPLFCCRLIAPSVASMPSGRLTLLDLLSLLHMMDAMDLVAVDWHCKGEYLFFAYSTRGNFRVDFLIAMEAGTFIDGCFDGFQLRRCGNPAAPFRLPIAATARGGGIPIFPLHNPLRISHALCTPSACLLRGISPLTIYSQYFAR